MLNARSMILRSTRDRDPNSNEAFKMIRFPKAVTIGSNSVHSNYFRTSSNSASKDDVTMTPNKSNA